MPAVIALLWHCAPKNKKGRLLERSEYQSYIEQNKKNIEAGSSTYKKRQAIVEHPYGTIKRQWGFYYVTTKKGISHPSADVGLMFIAYNLRRIMNIIGRNLLTKFLQELILLFFEKLILLKRFIFETMRLLFEKKFYQVFSFAL